MEIQAKALDEVTEGENIGGKGRSAAGNKDRFGRVTGDELKMPAETSSVWDCCSRQ